MHRNIVKSVESALNLAGTKGILGSKFFFWYLCVFLRVKTFIGLLILYIYIVIQFTVNFFIPRVHIILLFTR